MSVINTKIPYRKKYHIICKLCGKEFFSNHKNIKCCDNLLEIHKNEDCFFSCKKYNMINKRIDLALLLMDCVYLDFNPKLKIVFR